MIKSKNSDELLAAYVDGTANENDKIEVLNMLYKAPTLLLTINFASSCLESILTEV